MRVSKLQIPAFPLASSNNQDLTTVYRQLLSTFKDQSLIEETKRSRLLKENAKLAKELDKVKRSNAEAKRVAEAHAETSKKQAEDLEVLKRKLEEREREYERGCNVCHELRQECERVRERREDLQHYLSCALGVRFELKEPKNTILLDRIIPQRESVGCCITCKRDRAQFGLIPYKVEPPFPELARTLKMHNINDLFVFCFICRQLFRAGATS
eukprot:Blabericola_migrator_1__72@NODE_1018_length_5684_cov_169_427630_g699_i0_p3_GENE_NODE_1018_length_5684_cov_169_427630_g699_i0NODE_1018_length_5684_cov_169_427630_g699_i0_p3_ORF_typecomplete_len213_score31_74Yuri_gagarin/PF15934_5/0_002CENPK/PF11802_8/0_0022Taxilin/PF09728_9/0_0033GAS/PF13851_6/0_0035Leu_zip/PF15294_6/0_021Myosin_tail_1/PF01576_19/0_023ADIP/PF11559_8/0_059HOOK/PF05622_12/0_067CBF/PF03914_17/0_067MAD/PF05557_13/0_066CorA/PF01544_18/0_074FapA/PF03961_13/0_093DUF4698/PF15769_5/0_14FU